jgi:hypothetical protein
MQVLFVKCTKKTNTAATAVVFNINERVIEIVAAE